MWGFERHGLVPDMVVMGKPMGNGFPMGGVAIKPELLAAFGAKSGYFNTFGGNPVAAAAGLAVLDVLNDEGLRQNSFDTGAYLRSELRIAGSDRVCIGDVRGAVSISASISSRIDDRASPIAKPPKKIVNECATATS